MSCPEIRAVRDLRDQAVREVARLKATQKGIVRKIGETQARVDALNEALRRMHADALIQKP